MQALQLGAIRVLCVSMCVSSGEGLPGQGWHLPASRPADSGSRTLLWAALVEVMEGRSPLCAWKPAFSQTRASACDCKTVQENLTYPRLKAMSRGQMRATQRRPVLGGRTAFKPMWHGPQGRGRSGLLETGLTFHRYVLVQLQQLSNMGW